MKKRLQSNFYVGAKLCIEKRLETIELRVPDNFLEGGQSVLIYSQNFFTKILFFG